MNSRFNILKQLAIVTLCVMAVACQDTIPYRSTITPGSSSGNTQCEEGQTLTQVEDESEIPADKTKITVNGNIFYCKDPEITRPTGAVFWKADFCACKNTTPVTYGNCSSFCADKNTNGVETLFATFTVTEAISLSGLGNVEKWCNLNLPNDTENPVCEIQAKDSSGNVISLEAVMTANSNSLKADISSLSLDKTYVLTLVEKTSQAKSNSVQIIKFSQDISTPIIGPLKNAPISQYTCMVREFSSDDTTGDIYYDNAYRLHFYYIPSMPPSAVNATNLICHDIFNPLYGKVDNETYPRFENLAGVFNIWDKTDPRFYDNNGNGSVDVNELIIQKTRNFGGTVPASTNFFASFAWPGSPTLSTDAGNNSASTTTNTTLGYFMAPWIDQTTFKSYCLNSTHYNSTNPLFMAMRDIIQVDTEGLYIGEKSAETIVNPDGSVSQGYKDYILIRETDLKRVWFYLRSSTPTAPTDDNVANNAIYFYYPLNFASPYVKTSTQRLYRVRGANELGSSSNVSSGGSTSSGTTSSYPPHDRKIGCVPKF